MASPQALELIASACALHHGSTRCAHVPACIHACRKTVAVLKGMASANGHRFWLVDQLYMALAWGFGHALCHTTFFFASLLPLTAGSGTYYLDTCPGMSIFLAGALYSLAFGMLLTSLMVVFLDGMEARSLWKVAYVPLAHLGAAGLVSGPRHACMPSPRHAASCLRRAVPACIGHALLAQACSSSSGMPACIGMRANSRPCRRCNSLLSLLTAAPSPLRSGDHAPTCMRCAPPRGGACRPSSTSAAAGAWPSCPC